MTAVAAIAPLSITIALGVSSKVPKALIFGIPRYSGEEPIRIGPTNRAHESIDVARRLGVEVDCSYDSNTRPEPSAECLAHGHK